MYFVVLFTVWLVQDQVFSADLNEKIILFVSDKIYELIIFNYPYWAGLILSWWAERQENPLKLFSRSLINVIIYTVFCICINIYADNIKESIPKSVMDALDSGQSLSEIQKIVSRHGELALSARKDLLTSIKEKGKYQGKQ